MPVPQSLSRFAGREFGKRALIDCVSDAAIQR
jgi:hypothetical protein